MSITFTPIYLPENLGHGNARRISLQKSTYELVALMDADDISWARRFEMQLKKFLSDSKLDIVGGQISEFIGSPDNVIAKRIVPERHEDIHAYMKRRCPMNQVTVMFKKNAYEKAGGYIDWYCEEDYYLWIRMMQADCQFANVPDSLVDVRVGDEMSARRGGWAYFSSEAKLQGYMLKHKLISLPRFLYNVAIRFGGEVIVPTSLRTRLFKLMRTQQQSVNCADETSTETTEFLGAVKYPPFSVAMCVYGKDNPEWFDKALCSVIEQTVKPSEIVLVVDGPIPQELQSVISRYSDVCNMGG